jgi:hypothetical protein
VQTANLRALQLDFAVGPMIFEAFSSSGGQGEMVAVGQTQFFATPPFGPQNYEQLTLAAPANASIGSVVITGSAEASRFDSMVAFPFQAPCLTGDLAADRIEVTQAIQDLHNSVRLVAGKRTFVRFHVSVADGFNASTYATMVVRKGGSTRRKTGESLLEARPFCSLLAAQSVSSNPETSLCLSVEMPSVQNSKSLRASSAPLRISSFS